MYNGLNNTIDMYILYISHTLACRSHSSQSSCIISRKTRPANYYRCIISLSLVVVFFSFKTTPLCASSVSRGIRCGSCMPSAVRRPSYTYATHLHCTHERVCVHVQHLSVMEFSCRANERGQFTLIYSRVIVR